MGNCSSKKVKINKSDDQAKENSDQRVGALNAESSGVKSEGNNTLEEIELKVVNSDDRWQFYYNFKFNNLCNGYNDNNFK